MAHIIHNDPDGSAARDALIGRRRFIVGTGIAVAFGYLPVSALAQPSEILEFSRYRSTHLDPQTNTWVVQAIDWTLSQSNVPATHNLIVLADNLTIDGNIMLPGRSITLVARNLRVSGGTAKISTRGTKGVPSYTGQTAAPEQHGAQDTGKGMDGGTVTVLATYLEGALSIDTSGGVGGDAQKGGEGKKGEDGKPGTYDKQPTAAGNGGPGMPAGKPGDGGNAGNAFVLTESAATPAKLVAEGGKPGAQPGHGDPGKPGARAGATQGIHREQTTFCSTPDVH